LIGKSTDFNFEIFEKIGIVVTLTQFARLADSAFVPPLWWQLAALQWVEFPATDEADGVHGN
tara:strand:+ start:856 stop:1041 length:186 start_codon:yes stop_codon:yes gene_type:complete